MNVTSLYRAVVFDMDGVLLDSEAVYDLCWRREAERLGLDDIDGVHRQCLGRGKDESVALLKARYGEDFDGVSFWDATDRDCEELERTQGMPLKPFAREILRYLRGGGYKLALASSTSRATVLRQLTRLDLDVFFDAIVCGDEVLRAKPAPDIYVRACRMIGEEPAACAAVEDSPNGVLSAHSAGLACVMVPDRLPPDGEIKKLLWQLCASLEDLQRLL